MTRRVLIASALAAALAGGGVIAAAQPPQRGAGIPGGPSGPGPRRGGPGIDLLGVRGLDLTDAQREQVRSIMESHKAESDEAAAKLRDAHRAFAQAVEATTVDEATVRARSAAVATAMADEALLRAKIRAEVFAILTAEQLEQLKQRPRRRQ